MTMPRHNVFVSFHHGDEADSNAGIYWKNKFIRLMRDQTQGIIDKSVNDGDIDPNDKVDNVRRKIRDEFIRDASVCVVLIGPETWKRKHVDWEIGSAIRQTRNNSRCGLLGILLPTYPLYSQKKYNPHTIPPRLYDNLKAEETENIFASLRLWTENAQSIKQWIHEAYLRRDKIIPDNSYPQFANNRPQDQKQWQ